MAEIMYPAVERKITENMAKISKDGDYTSLILMETEDIYKTIGTALERFTALWNTWDKVVNEYDVDSNNLYDKCCKEFEDFEMMWDNLQELKKIYNN